MRPSFFHQVRICSPSPIETRSTCVGVATKFNSHNGGRASRFERSSIQSLKYLLPRIAATLAETMIRAAIDVSVTIQWLYGDNTWLPRKPACSFFAIDSTAYSVYSDGHVSTITNLVVDRRLTEFLPAGDEMGAERRGETDLFPSAQCPG